MNALEQYVQQHAQSQPHAIAVVCDGQQLTYAQLWQQVSAAAAQLAGQGGALVPMMAHRTPQFVVQYLAAHLAGKAAVPLAPDAPTHPNLNASCPATVADVLFTTGTTGLQKGVMVSHSAIVANAQNLVEAQGYHPGIKFVLAGPLNHIGSLSKLWPTLLVGGTIVIAPEAQRPEWPFCYIRGNTRAH